MGKIVERRRKKKGRPSLLDLQKRSLQQQQQQQQQHQQHRQQHKQNRIISKHNSHNPTLRSSPNYKSATPTPLRRSTRRNPTPSSPNSLHNHIDEDDDDAESSGRRREKKLKLVLKLPSSQKSDPNSSSLNSNGSDSNHEEDQNTASNHRKRKVDAIGDGSGFGSAEKREKSASDANPTNDVQDSGPSTPLPDKKLLLFILDRLQKKDTYGVFSEAVDPEELPDYHEVIEHPMDFGTVKKKLSSNSYANLEQFEKDVFLICSNAMQYNAPDTIYFRQARSIQELAKKNFENLRQDSDDNEPETKIVRRGRPPMKNFKKPLGRPPLERAGSEFSSDATPAIVAEGATLSTNNLRKGSCLADRPGLADSRCLGSCNNDSKLERNDEATGSAFKSVSMKHWKKQSPPDENRRSTYKQLQLRAGGQEPSVLSTFDAERKQLMAVGLLSEHGYARSLARFAANIGPVAWKIASKKIERCLPPGIKYGPGWVGENDVPAQRPLLPSSTTLHRPSSSSPFSLWDSSNLIMSLQTVESREGNSPEKPEEKNLPEKLIPSTCSGSEGHLISPLLSSSSTFTCDSGTIKSEPPKDGAEAVNRLNRHTGYYVLDSSVGVIQPRPLVQMHQSPVIHRGMNGFNGTYGYNLPAQMGKLIGSSKPAGVNFQSCQAIGTVSATNTNFVRSHPAMANSLNSEDSELPNNQSTITSRGPLLNSGSQAMEDPRFDIEHRPSWQGLSTQSKSDSVLSRLPKSDLVPPDLNVRFQTPGSPSSTRVDSAQPDLALQL